MIPICMLLHPVGIGSTRAMNVASAKMWLRALVDAMPDVAFEAGWLAYADIAIDRERGIHDAICMLERCDAVVAVGGEFSRGMHTEWQRAKQRNLHCMDLTRPPMPSILTIDSFIETRTLAFRQAVTDAFRGAKVRVAA